jgi:hypothetical protein
MGSADREVRIGTGRRAGDGSLRLSVFAEELLALTVEGRGERAPTLLLTPAQARELGAALEGLASLVGEETPGRGAGRWGGGERRRGSEAG